MKKFLLRKHSNVFWFVFFLVGDFVVFGALKPGPLGTVSLTTITFFILLTYFGAKIFGEGVSRAFRYLTIKSVRVPSKKLRTVWFWGVQQIFSGVLIISYSAWVLFSGREFWLESLFH